MIVSTKAERAGDLVIVNENLLIFPLLAGWYIFDIENFWKVSFFKHEGSLPVIIERLENNNLQRSGEETKEKNLKKTWKSVIRKQDKRQKH